MLKLGWRVKIKGKFGRDPMLCERCGREMILWRIWTPGYGVLYYLPDAAPEWTGTEQPLQNTLIDNAQLSLGF
jgi:hypothetical protein